MSWFPNHEKTVVNGWYIHFFHVTLPSQKEKNMLWIIHGHHRIFVKNLPETFPENSHPFISSRGVLSIVTHQMLGFLMFGLGRRGIHPTTRLQEFASTYHDRIFCLPPPYQRRQKGEIYKVPLTSVFKLGLCGMVSSFFGGWVVRVVWNPIFSSSFCCFSPTWAPPTTTQFLRKAKKSCGPGWLRFVVHESLEPQTRHFLKRFRDFFGMVGKNGTRNGR